MVFSNEKSLEYEKKVTSQIVLILNRINDIANKINNLYKSIDIDNFENSHEQILKLLNELKQLFSQLIEVDTLVYEYFENAIKIIETNRNEDLLKLYNQIKKNSVEIIKKIDENIKLNNINSLNEVFNNWKDIHRLIISNNTFEFEFTELCEEVINNAYGSCIIKLNEMELNYSNDIFKNKMIKKLYEIKETNSVIAMKKLNEIIFLYVNYIAAVKNISFSNTERKEKITKYFENVFENITKDELEIPKSTPNIFLIEPALINEYIKKIVDNDNINNKYYSAIKSWLSEDKIETP